MIEQPDWLVAARRRPKLRGVLHAYAFVVSLGLGVVLVVGADAGRPRLSAAIFAASVSTMLGISALYHRVIWPPGPRRWIRRLDHAAIFLLIAGTYTPFGLLALEGAWRLVVLSLVWTGALAAIVLKVTWIDAPRWVAAVIAVCLGWVGAFAMPKIYERAGLAALIPSIADTLAANTAAATRSRVVSAPNTSTAPSTIETKNAYWWNTPRNFGRRRAATSQSGCSITRLAVAVDDPPATEIVGRQFDLDLVAREDPDPVAAHLAGGVAERFVSVLERDPEEAVTKGLDHLALELDFLFLAGYR